MFRHNKTLCALLLLVTILPGLRAAANAATADPITEPAQLLDGPNTSGRTGDYLLANDRVQVIVSAAAHAGYYANTGGHIIDAATVENRYDALSELYPYFDDDWPRQANYDLVEIADDGQGGGPAVIRATGVDSETAALLVVTEYSLADGDDYVTLTTTLTNTGASPLSGFEAGDAFAWGGCDCFVPYQGFSPGGTTSEFWLAGVAEQVTYGFLAQGGLLWGPHGSTWSNVNVTTLSLPAGASAAYTRFLIVGDEDMGSLTKSAHALFGFAVGGLRCEVSETVTGAPLGDAVIDVYSESGLIYLQLRCDDEGVTEATLPPGTWRLDAVAPGHGDEEVWTVIHEGIDTTVYIELDGDAGGWPLGDEISVIQRPLLNVPAIVTPGDTLLIECEAAPEVTGWSAELNFGAITEPLTIVDAAYNADTTWWELRTVAPAGAPLYELYDLRVTAGGGVDDTTANAVRIIPEERDDFCFIQITDTHLPTTRYYSEAGAETDSSSLVDFRAVIHDVNIINPEFVLLTGDLVNEGELEDFLNRRYYSRAQRLLTELDVPVYLVAGNHDLGGWDSTPPSDGTSRRDWWRFFGWPRLDNPPAGAPWRTQNYSFDYGPVHFTGLEAYDNYDMWRSQFYGAASFTSPQVVWLMDDLAAASAARTHVLFYHYDFNDQINLSYLGADMALWGHIHYDSGSIHSQPYDLATDNTCDGNRAFRVVKVRDGVLDPRPTLRSGATGNELSVIYDVQVDGGTTTSTAQVRNLMSESFETGLLRFTMPNGPGDYSVDRGTLIQIDASGEEAVCYVEYPIPAASVTEVVMTYSATGVGDQPAPCATALLANHPNPFNPWTRLRYSLAADRDILLTIHDAGGREVARLHDGRQSAGEHEIEWRAEDDAGRALPSGVYLLRLETAERTLARKLTLVR